MYIWAGQPAVLTVCVTFSVFSRYDRTTLEELILLPLEDGGGILDVDAEVGKYLSDEDLRRLLFEVYGIEHPHSLQNMEKTRRNEIIGHLKSEGEGIVADFCLDRMLLLSTKIFSVRCTDFG